MTGPETSGPSLRRPDAQDGEVDLKAAMRALAELPDILLAMQDQLDTLATMRWAEAAEVDAGRIGDGLERHLAGVLADPATRVRVRHGAAAVELPPTPATITVHYTGRPPTGSTLLDLAADTEAALTEALREQSVRRQQRWTAGRAGARTSPGDQPSDLTDAGHALAARLAPLRGTGTDRDSLVEIEVGGDGSVQVRMSPEVCRAATLRVVEAATQEAYTVAAEALSTAITRRLDDLA